MGLVRFTESLYSLPYSVFWRGGRKNVCLHNEIELKKIAYSSQEQIAFSLWKNPVELKFTGFTYFHYESVQKQYYVAQYWSIRYVIQVCMAASVWIRISFVMLY